MSDSKLDSKTVGRRIQSYRKKAHLTQAEVAEKLNVSSNYISQIERGVSDVSLKKLIKIASTIQTSAQSLIADSDASVPEYLHNEIFDTIKNWPPAKKKLLINVISALDKYE